jgi:repressor LexA
MEDFKALRKTLNMTQEDVAIKLGITPRSYQRWEKEPEKLSKTDMDRVLDILGGAIDIRMSIIKQGFDLVEVPYYEDVRASMGNGILNHESSVKKISFDITMLREIYKLYCVKDLSLINAYGDSMSPTIPSDSVVFIQKSEIPDGAICAALLDGELYIKRLQKRPALKLISDNKSYDDIPIGENDNFIILGKVVGIFKIV